MKKLNLIFCAFSLMLAITSCTNFSMTKVPGKQASEFPSEMIGTYELRYPDDIQSLMDVDSAESKKVLIKIEKNKLLEINGDETKTYLLGDSIFYSTVGKSAFLSMGPNPNYMVMKIKKEGNDYSLFASYVYEEVDPADLKKYASKVEEEKFESEDGSEGDDMGMKNYILTIKEKKIDAFYDSKYVSKSPCKLIRQ